MSPHLSSDPTSPSPPPNSPSIGSKSRRIRQSIKSHTLPSPTPTQPNPSRKPAMTVDTATPLRFLNKDTDPDATPLVEMPRTPLRTLLPDHQMPSSVSPRHLQQPSSGRQHQSFLTSSSPSGLSIRSRALDSELGLYDGESDQEDDMVELHQQSHHQHSSNEASVRAPPPVNLSEPPAAKPLPPRLNSLSSDPFLTLRSDQQVAAHRNESTHLHSRHDFANVRHDEGRSDPPPPSSADSFVSATSHEHHSQSQQPSWLSAMQARLLARSPSAEADLRSSHDTQDAEDEEERQQILRNLQHQMQGRLTHSDDDDPPHLHPRLRSSSGPFTSSSLPSSSGILTGPSPRNRKLSLYKTEKCRSWEEKGSCKYGNKCQFAHGDEELRAILRHPKYKTEICRTFWRTGSCPYAKRCCFIHTTSGVNVSDSTSASLHQLSMMERVGKDAHSRATSHQSSDVGTPSYVSFNSSSDVALARVREAFLSADDMKNSVRSPAEPYEVFTRANTAVTSPAFSTRSRTTSDVSSRGPYSPLSPLTPFSARSALDPAGSPNTTYSPEWSFAQLSLDPIDASPAERSLKAYDQRWLCSSPTPSVSTHALPQRPKPLPMQSTTATSRGPLDYSSSPPPLISAQGSAAAATKPPSRRHPPIGLGLDMGSEQALDKRCSPVVPNFTQRRQLSSDLPSPRSFYHSSRADTDANLSSPRIRTPLDSSSSTAPFWSASSHSLSDDYMASRASLRSEAGRGGHQDSSLSSPLPEGRVRRAAVRDPSSLDQAVHPSFPSWQYDTSMGAPVLPSHPRFKALTLSSPTWAPEGVLAESLVESKRTPGRDVKDYHLSFASSAVVPPMRYGRRPSPPIFASTPNLPRPTDRHEQMNLASVSVPRHAVHSSPTLAPLQVPEKSKQSGCTGNSVAVPSMPVLPQPLSSFFDLHERSISSSSAMLDEPLEDTVTSDFDESHELPLRLDDSDEEIDLRSVKELDEVLNSNKLTVPPHESAPSQADANATLWGGNEIKEAFRFTADWL